MQISTARGNGTALVTQTIQTVTAQSGVEWSAALPGSWFTVIGSGISYEVGAVSFSGGLWHLTLTGNYIAVTNAAAPYVIQIDFDANGAPIFALGDTEVLTLLNRWTSKIAATLGAGSVRQKITIAGGLIGATTIPVVFPSTLSAVPTHINRPVFEKVSSGDDNIDAVSVDSITVNGYNVNLSAPAISGQKLHTSYIP